MQVVSIFIAVLAVSRFAIAQSQSGYNYPSPFNQLSPGAAGDLGGVPGSNAQQPISYPGSQPAYNNQQFTPSGPQGPPSSFGTTPTPIPSYNQQSFGQPTAVSLPASIPGGHSSIPGGHSSVPSHSSGGFGPSSASSGFPATSVPSSKGFESSFPHQGHSSTAGHVGGHSGSHSGSVPSSHVGIAGTSFPAQSSGFPAVDSGSAGFGAPSAPGFSQGQPSFGGQGNNFGGQGSSGGENDGSYPGGDYSAIPGVPGQDYPIYTEIPKTSFDCKQQQYPGYYADVEAQCQVFHICALNTTFNFLCPNGTIFSQEHLVCVWWNQFDCNSAPSLYGNNAYIYDYSKTGQSQDGQGPSRNFGNAPDAGNSFDGGAQVPGFVGAQGGSPGFGGASQPGSGFGPSSSGSIGSGAGFGPSSVSPGFGGQSPSTGFGPSAAGAPAFSVPSGSSGFGPSSSGAPGFGSGATVGYPSSSSAGNIPASGFGQPTSSHSSGFGQSHVPSSIPSVGASHTPSHNIPSSHSFPSQSHGGAEQYPIVPPSQTDYNQSPVIVPTIPSSPAPFIPGGPATGYPPAGTPPSGPALTAEQPSREYLPQRRTK
ncbi:uncharacterized protein LOC129580581 isoform X2 [Sitodiplosis mosellana]|uniref:uncharacterized protein LOC129580581 isoform X2 n=1 Tax=Sitodiplosis mosellana TaxID=263140 RepID=UPI002444490F|nr:uncharacterized protein LOC129580581 isoform X2 [Sitodiplosis mosellana]